MMEYRIRGTKVVMPYPAKLTPGEVRLVFGLEKVFGAQRILADCYFPKAEFCVQDEVRKVAGKSDLIQVDCIAVDESGVYVFESKDYVGWIYAHGERAYWTQVTGFGQNKQQFYSPVRQNRAHIDAIRTILGEKMPIYSVIVFGREAVLKVVEGMPENCIVCTQNNVRQIVAEMRREVKITEVEVEEIYQALRKGLVNPDGVVRAEHIGEVQEIVQKK